MEDLNKKIDDFIKEVVIDRQKFINLFIEMCKSKISYNKIHKYEKLFKKINMLNIKSKGEAYRLIEKDFDMLIQDELNKDIPLIHKIENIEAYFGILEACDFNSKPYDFNFSFSIDEPEIDLYNSEKRKQVYSFIENDFNMLVQDELDRNISLMHKFENIKSYFDVLDVCNFNSNLYSYKRKEVYLYFLDQTSKFNQLIQNSEFGDYDEYKYDIKYCDEELVYESKIVPTKIIDFLIYKDLVCKNKNTLFLEGYIDLLDELSWENFELLQNNALHNVMSYFNKLNINEIISNTEIIKNELFEKFLSLNDTVEVYNTISYIYYENKRRDNHLDKSLKFINKAIQLQKNEGILYINRALINIKMLNYMDAMDDLKKVINNDLKFGIETFKFKKFEDEYKLEKFLNEIKAITTDEAFKNNINIIIKKLNVLKSSKYSWEISDEILNWKKSKKQFIYNKSKYDQDYEYNEFILKKLDDMEYNSRYKGPDWLGGVETEEEFWSHT